MKVGSFTFSLTNYIEVMKNSNLVFWMVVVASRMFYISTYFCSHFSRKWSSFLQECVGGGVTHSKEVLNSFTMTWKTLKTQWNDQTIKKNEDWWHKDKSTTADLLRCLQRGWDVMEGQCSLIVDGTYCHPFFCLTPWMHEVCIKEEHESWQELMSVKAQKKMTLPVHQGQSWW